VIYKSFDLSPTQHCKHKAVK